MVRLTLMLLLFLAGRAAAGNPVRIPADSRGNLLLLSIENASVRTDLESLTVRVLKHGPGIIFHSGTARVLLVPRGQSVDAGLLFDVDRSAPLDRPDTLLVSIERQGRTLATHAAVWICAGPAVFFLDQNYPNPFNASTTIHYALPVRAGVQIDVYDILGRHVSTLAEGVLERGFRSVRWDGTTPSGIPAGTGVYILRMAARPEDGGEDFLETRKLILLR